MLKCYHGTTKENFKRIMESGFDPQNQNWNCSNNGYIYFWGYDPDQEHENSLDEESEALHMSNGNAQITAAIQNSKETDIVIIEMHLNEEILENDYSCENMNGAFEVDAHDLDIKDIKKVYTADYNPCLRLFYVRGLFNGDNMYFDRSNFNVYEMEALEAIKDCEIYSIHEAYPEEAEINDILN